jgi:hypothetical protein
MTGRNVSAVLIQDFDMQPLAGIFLVPSTNGSYVKNFCPHTNGGEWLLSQELAAAQLRSFLSC